MFYYVYVLQSFKNGSLYIGYTTNIDERFESHNKGENRSTKPFIPYKLIHYETYLSRVDAKNREEYLKGGYGRRSINAMLRDYLNA